MKALTWIRMFALSKKAECRIQIPHDFKRQLSNFVIYHEISGIMKASLSLSHTHSVAIAHV